MTDCECKELQSKVVLLDERQKHLREVMELRFNENGTSIKLAAAETSRRLDLLNGEAGRLASMQATYLPRELYEQHQRAMADSLSQTRRAVLVAFISSAGSIILLLANWLLKTK